MSRAYARDVSQMTATLGTLLRDRAATLTGRDRERAALLGLVVGDAARSRSSVPSVAVIWLTSRA